MHNTIHTYSAVPKTNRIKSTEIDPIQTEIIRNALNSAANQMKQALCRTAFSPIIYEVLDFASAIYDKDVRLLSQAPSLPLFMGTLNFCVEAAVEGVGGIDNLFEGDIIIYNNPYGTGAHQPDVALVMPVFFKQKLIGYTAIKAHWLDIGAKDPYCSDTIDYFQEGIIFPGVKLFEKGKPVESIHKMILANSRVPEAINGDMRAQCIGLHAGAKSFTAIVEKYGEDTFFDCVEAIFEHGETVVKNYFKKIPNGTYNAQGMMDNNGITDDCIPFNISIEIKDEEVIIDYSDTPQQQEGPVNCPLPSTVSAARIAISMLAGGGESPTEGHFRPIKVITKKGTMFHPRPPAPCFLYGWPAMQSIEVIYRAIGNTFPEFVPADSSGDICSMVFWGTNSKTNEIWADGSPYPSGQGASNLGNGSSVLHIAESATRFSPTEVRESMYPYIINKVEFAQDSCGAGEQIGGLGIDFYFEFLDDTSLTATLEKTKTKPRGLLGGKEGVANNCIAFFPNGEQKVIGKTTRHFLPKGTKLHLKTGGGGGYNMPNKRHTERIFEDIENELISKEYATTHYPQFSE
ncbi:hydantoinase B/oxoprolinase family protein [Flavobacteriaceae bacterium LMO-SS05]